MARSLTKKQAVFTDHVAKGLAPTKAARIAGYAYPGQDAYKLMRHPSIRDALHQRRDAALRGDLASLALDAMRDLMKPETPAATRYQASKWVLEHAGHRADEPDDQQARPLEEMNADELARAVTSGMQALQDLAGQLEGHHVVDGQARPVQVIEHLEEEETSFLE